MYTFSKQLFIGLTPSPESKFSHNLRLSMVVNSVTIFSEISPLWQNFKVFGQLLKALFALAKLKIFFGNILCDWANLHPYTKWPNIEKYTSHLVTL